MAHTIPFVPSIWRAGWDALLQKSGGAFDESEHPRVPAGSERGGQFEPKGGGAAGDSGGKGAVTFMSDAVSAEKDLPADVRPYEYQISALRTRNDLSVEAERAWQEGQAHAHWRNQEKKKFEHGPYYQNGQLRIPAYYFNPIKTPRAAAEWKKRGLIYDGDKKEWWMAIPLDKAVPQTRKARAVFDTIWGIDRAKV